jgi:hypothetical protein
MKVMANAKNWIKPGRMTQGSEGECKIARIIFFSVGNIRMPRATRMTIEGARTKNSGDGLTRNIELLSIATVSLRLSESAGPCCYGARIRPKLQRPPAPPEANSLCKFLTSGRENKATYVDWQITEVIKG